MNFRRGLRRNRLSVFVQAALLASLAAASQAAANELTVTSNADSGPGTLRDAFNAAGDGDTIVFDCVALACPATITLTSQGNNQGFPGPTALSLKGRTLTIQGPPGGSVALQAQPGGSSSTSLRLFYVAGDAALTLSDLALSGGHAIGGSAVSGGGGAAGLGGAIFSDGALVLDGVRIASNAASGGHGGPGNGLAGPFFWCGGGGLGGDGGYNPQGGGGGTGGNGFPRTQGGGMTTGGQGGPGYGGSGGGSGGVYQYSQPGQSSAGADGVNGGGGGNGLFNHGGAGSEGGGGGGGISYGGGGAGGFGGGGGAGITTSGPGGSGGFGGGGGGGDPAGAGGVGAGSGGHCIGFSPIFYCGGGGGAGFGGALFARSGSVTLSGAGGLISGNSVSGGGATDHGGNGATAGAGLFLMSGVTAAFDVAGSYRIDDPIGDDSAASVPPDQGYTPGNGAGVGIVKQGAGTLVLAAANTYAGGTTIGAGILRVDGTVGDVVIDGGALGGTGSVGAVALDSGGAIAPGDAVGTLSAAEVTWNGGGAMTFDLGPAASDLLALTGNLSKGTGSGFLFHFRQDWNPPAAGTTYTLIQAAGTDFSAGDFSFDFAAPLTDLTGTFAIDGNVVKFTVSTVSSDRIFGDGFD